MNEINDQWGRKQRVLANIEDTGFVSSKIIDARYWRHLRDSLMTSHEDICIVLIQSTLVVTNGWHVLDDNCVVRVFTLLVKHCVGLNHVIDNVGLGNLLGAELLLGAEVLSVIVAQVIVAGDGGELDTGTDQEVDQSGLHLGLAGLEVITTNESIVPLSKLNGTRNKCVLRRAVDEWDALEDASNSEDSGWSNFIVAFSIAFKRLSAVSLTPGISSAKRSVLAVHWTMTLSNPFLALKSLVLCEHGV